MKKFLPAASGAAFATFAVSVFVYVNNGNNEMDDLFNANVEALAGIEDGGQPNVNDCISDLNYSCEALHPTDPSKDVLRRNARW